MQLDDELLAQLDREARRSKRSRSELIRRAVKGWFDAQRIARLEREHAEGYRRIPDDDDPAWSEALVRLAAEVAPPYDA